MKYVGKKDEKKATPKELNMINYQNQITCS